jgi:ketosteroid isomerase-like protein
VIENRLTEGFTMQMKTIGALAASAALCACSAFGPQPSPQQARLEVVAVERAFAKSMADRDLTAFASYLSEEAIFFSGPTPLRGKSAVVAYWSRFYSAPAAPFSWEPEEVEVLDSGTLALSSGPVRNPKGDVSARYSSIWRREAGGWRIIFDKGSPVCNCATP